MNTNQPLEKNQRTQLENTVQAARDIAERAANAALAELGVGEAKPSEHLSDAQRTLRRRLRAHSRALGDLRNADGTQETRQLMWEVAYEHWHRMLFARFLAENGLLMWEPGAPITLSDCKDMVVQHPELAMGAKTHWELAGKLAARMLPQVFKSESPVFELVFAFEYQRELEELLTNLQPDTFRASDSLGWVYQFWQAKRKDEVNASGEKIGAAELPAVTQLFTEPYMVDFLLHNSLGAWWATRHPGKASPVPFTYFRTLDDGTPAAGKFEGWPDTLAEFRLIDPCCGSGHFLVAAFLLLVPMRMAAEGLSAMDAVDYVLQDNLHGLELDARCVEIAVFALALAAWRFPGESGEALGVRADMPKPNVACCGLKLTATADDWAALMPDALVNKELVEQDLRRLHADFAQSPLLGSLMDPSRNLRDDLATSSFAVLRGLLERALRIEARAGKAETDSEGGEDALYQAITALGLMEAAQLLEARYHLVITNVPYLSRSKQSDKLKDYCATHYGEAKNDLANVFLDRCLELSDVQGVVQIVMPQNWLFLTSYKKQRKSLLKRAQFNLVALLGAKSFQTPMWDFNVQLLTMSNTPATSEFQLHGMDISAPKVVHEKAALLREGMVLAVNQKEQLGNPDARIILADDSNGTLLSFYATSHLGVCSGDYSRFGKTFWEVGLADDVWTFQQSTVSSSQMFSGLSQVFYWEKGAGDFMRYLEERLGENQVGSWLRGSNAWGGSGIAITATGKLPVSLYRGTLFDNNLSVVVPSDSANIPALWSYMSSPSFHEDVRTFNQQLKITDQSFVEVKVDLSYWEKIATERYPDGLPKPYSDDPTQWLFHGYPKPATDPLQVAVARLAGYCWPAEADKSMDISSDAREWIAHCAALSEQIDDDGIICMPSVRGEPAAHDRLLRLLITAWEAVEPGSWKNSTLDQLLADADCAGKGLDVWLREKFFEQHAKRFHHRPFIWHVWDGLKDGFAALVNYHKLDAKNLERLIHTYLGDWIRQQENGVRENIDGAPIRLAAALDLKRRLELILVGEKPYDIFVRWKPLSEQPIGWNPDLNDGVRLNIRPFMNAEVLRHNKKPKLNITWDKDRGKDVTSAPWYPVFQGDRINDHHLSLAEKSAARDKNS